MSTEIVPAPQPGKTTWHVTHRDLPSYDGEQMPPIRLITHLDLPHTDDRPVENSYQPHQMALLTEALIPHLKETTDGNYQIGQDLGIYWRMDDPPTNGCKAPDWCYIPGVPPLLNGQLRLSYVMWHEGLRPLVVMEFVSGDGRDERDATPLTGKFWVYANGIGAPYYVIHDRARGLLEVYHRDGNGYQRPAPDSEGRYPIPAMGLLIGHWTGNYREIDGLWLRFFKPDGSLLPTDGEQKATLRARVDAEQECTTRERSRAEAEKSRADALQALLDKLKAQGMDANAP